jgi:DNA polymerase-3 subunit gamma/tau
MMVSVDPGRAGDGELAEGERERLLSLAERFSREDLMRAFDLLAKAETDIRAAAHPRYHFEMALLRWMHLRKLVPLTDLMEQLGGAGGGRLSAPAGASSLAPTRARSAAPTGSSGIGSTREPLVAPAATGGMASGRDRTVSPTAKGPVAPTREATVAPTGGAPLSPAQLKDALLAEIRSGKKILYELSVASAQRIDVSEDAVTFTFGTNQNAARGSLEQSRSWIEAAAQRLAGRRIGIVVVQSAPAAPPSGATATAPQPKDVASSVPADQPKASGRDLKAEALSSSAVQAMLDVFPAEIRDVEEM